MKMSNHYKKLCLVLGLSTVFSAGIVDAANYTKTLKATYRNIQVTYNGVVKSISEEPFAIDGTTYVPLRAVSQILGANVDWDGTNNLVKITNTVATDNSSQVTSLQQQLATANYNLAIAQREVESLKAELANYKQDTSTGTDISTAALSKTLAYIQETYGTENRIDWTFDLTQNSSGKLELEISYDSRNDESRFNRISSSELRLFTQDICADIRKNHSDIEIVGSITDSRSDWDKATFTYSKTNKISFNLMSDNYYDTAKDLSRYYTSFSNIAYTTSTENGKFTLPIDSIELAPSSRSLLFTVKVKLSNVDLQTKWKGIQTNDTVIEDDLYDMQIDIEKEYSGVDVEGQIVDTVTGNIIATIDANGRFSYR